MKIIECQNARAWGRECCKRRGRQDGGTECNATKRQLTKLGVPFETVDLTENPGTLEQLQAAGFQQAPVVITPNNSWTGYRPDLIREVAQQVSAEANASAMVSA